MSGYILNPDQRNVIFSTCRTYRYLLAQVWDTKLPPVIWIMLNPSTADTVQDDPTVKRCMIRAWESSNYGSCVILNLFAYRSTNPLALYSCDDPVGPDNDMWIKTVCEAHYFGKLPKIIFAWGSHGTYLDRDRRVQQIVIEECKRKAYCLTVNKNGTPKHPLYIPFRTNPRLYIPR